MKLPENSGVKSYVTLIAAVVTLIGSIIGSVIAYVGVTNQSNASLVKTLLSEKAILEERDIELRAEMLQLRIQVQQKYEPAQDVKRLLDAMPFPVWIKHVYTNDDGSPEFIMWHINEAYERAYNVSNEFYAGKTDEMVYGKETADTFRAADIRVLGRRETRCEVEHWQRDSSKPASKTNPRIPGYVCKFTTDIANRLSVVGLALDLDQINRRTLTQ